MLVTILFVILAALASTFHALPAPNFPVVAHETVTPSTLDIVPSSTLTLVSAPPTTTNAPELYPVVVGPPPKDWQATPTLGLVYHGTTMTTDFPDRWIKSPVGSGPSHSFKYIPWWNTTTTTTSTTSTSSTTTTWLVTTLRAPSTTQVLTLRYTTLPISTHIIPTPITKEARDLAAASPVYGTRAPAVPVIGEVDPTMSFLPALPQESLSALNPPCVSPYEVLECSGCDLPVCEYLIDADPCSKESDCPGDKKFSAPVSSSTPTSKSTGDAIISYLRDPPVMPSMGHTCDLGTCNATHCWMCDDIEHATPMPMNAPHHPGHHKDHHKGQHTDDLSLSKRVPKRSPFYDVPGGVDCLMHSLPWHFLKCVKQKDMGRQIHANEVNEYKQNVKASVDGLWTKWAAGEDMCKYQGQYVPGFGELHFPGFGGDRCKHKDKHEKRKDIYDFADDYNGPVPLECLERFEIWPDAHGPAHFVDVEGEADS